MANELNIPVVGNLTRDPETRHTASGVAVTNFAVAHTVRKFSQEENGMVDGQTTFFDVSVWREQGENVEASLKKGDRVIILGEIVQETFERKDGTTGTKLKIENPEVGVSLRFATAKPVRLTNETDPRDKRSGGSAKSEAKSEAQTETKAKAKPKPADDGSEDF